MTTETICKKVCPKGNKYCKNVVGKYKSCAKCLIESDCGLSGNDSKHSACVQSIDSGCNSSNTGAIILIIFGSIFGLFVLGAIINNISKK